MKNNSVVRDQRHAESGVSEETYRKLWADVIAIARKNKGYREGLKALGLIPESFK